MTIRSRAAVAAASVLALGAAASGAFADTNVPVTTVVVNGTRTLNVTDPTGAAIGNTGLPLGAGHGGSLLVNVTDVDYKRAGYQVSATMSNLYPYTSGSYDFGSSPIPSSAISVAYPSSLFDLDNLSSLVQPVVELTGSVHLAGLPLPVSIDQTVDGAAKEASAYASTVTQALYSGLLSKLPITLQTGDTGAFDHPAGLPGQSGDFSQATPKVLMSGSPQAPTTASLTSALNSVYGGLTAQQLISAGLLDQNAVVTAVAQAAGLTPDQITGAQQTALLTSLTGTVTGIVGSLVGQTGSYNTLPQLNIDVPSNTAAGVYRGQLTVTLMDK